MVQCRDDTTVHIDSGECTAAHGLIYLVSLPFAGDQTEDTLRGGLPAKILFPVFDFSRSSCSSSCVIFGVG